MTNPKIVREQVDIYQLPAAPQGISPSKKEISIGDLHGSSMKLLFMLIRHGVISGIVEEDYNELVRIYRIQEDGITNNLTQADIEGFNAIISQAKVNPDAAKIRLIGDELADRGQNDYFTLKIFQKLHEGEVDLEILYSNHAQLFIHYCVNCNTGNTENPWPPDMLADQFCSVFNLDKIIKKSLVARDEVTKIINDVYLPKLKLISYSLDSGNTGITLYTHAPVGLETIQAIAEKFGIEYRDDNPKELADTIDAINEHFLENYVKHNRIHELVDINMKVNERVVSDNPFYNLIWNRHLDHLKRPNVHKGYTVNYAHGHDSKLVNDPHIHNFDNSLAKIVRDGFGRLEAMREHNPENNQGEYHYLEYDPAVKYDPVLADLSGNDEEKQSIIFDPRTILKDSGFNHGMNMMKTTINSQPITPDSKTMEDLFYNLQDEKNKFISGENSGKEFVQNSNQFIEQASSPSWIEKVLQFLKEALAKIAAFFKNIFQVSEDNSTQDDDRSSTLKP